MIPLISFLPFLKRAAPYLIALAVLVGGVFFYGHTRFNAGQEQVQAKWDADKAERQAVLDRAVADKVRIEAEWKRKEKESVDAIQKKLAAVTARADDLDGRLRRFYSRPRALSETAAPATGSDGASPVGSGQSEADARVGAAVDDFSKQCEVDGIWLNYWIERCKMEKCDQPMRDSVK